MKKILLLVLVTGTLNSFAQKAAKPEKFAGTITPAELKEHLYVIASPEMGGRETGMEGERKAAAYIENEFRKIGLQPGNNGSFHMNYHLYQDSLLHAALEINGVVFKEDQDFNASVNGMAAKLRFSEVVVVPQGSADVLKDLNLAGKLVLLFPSQQQPQRGIPAMISALFNKGVAGVLSVSSGYPRTNAVNRKGRQGIYNFYRTQMPMQFSISDKAARAILGKSYEDAASLNGKTLTVQSNIFMQMDKTTIALPTSNVIGILPGTDLADEYLFITAHHDHIGKRGDVINYGADDDGSGTVSVIEIAEAFAEARRKGHGPRRTVVFMTVSGEEKGLLGSEFYSNHPIFPMEKTTANLNIDMIGRMDPSRKHGDSTNYVYVVGDDKLSSDLRPISESINKKYSKLELDYKFNDPKDPMRIYYRSDHYNFAKNGVPIIFYFNGTHADYHRPTDTPDKINYSLLAKRARFVFHTAWEMANRNGMLKRDIPLDMPPR